MQAVLQVQPHSSYHVRLIETVRTGQSNSLRDIKRRLCISTD